VENQKLLDDLSREGLTLASNGKRIGAFVIDKVIISLLFTFIAMDGLQGTPNFEEIVAYVNSLLPYYLLLEFIYHGFFIWYNGATPGKVLLKIRIIDTGYFDKPTLPSALLRSLVRLSGEFIFYLNNLLAFINPQKQTLQDRVAKTVAIDV
jgi:uncharacterized RDD family membrane protein YckC